MVGTGVPGGGPSHGGVLDHDSDASHGPLSASDAPLLVVPGPPASTRES
jgi:hypothetical protein